MKRLLVVLSIVPMVCFGQTVKSDSTFYFPVLLVDTAVSNRLAEEWEPNNRYQHERGYCVLYTTEYHEGNIFDPPVVIYRLTKVVRADESGTSPSGIVDMTCPGEHLPFVTFLHVHPPTTCADVDEGTSCKTGGEYSNQCYPSSTDMRTLLNSSKPFELIQCDRHAIVPFWRKAHP